MRYFALAVTAVLLLTLSGWGEQLTPGEQAHASIAAHKYQADNNPERRHHRHHRRHHRRHHGHA